MKLHPSSTPLLACLAIAISGLAACSRPADAPTAESAKPVAAYLAVARGKIDIEGGLLALAMPREGNLASVDVHEGDHVKRGQLLATLDNTPATLAVDAAKAQMEQAQAQLKLLSIKQQAMKLRAQRLAAAARAGAGDGQSADDATEAAAQLGAEQLADRAAADMAAQKLAEARYELRQRSLYAPFDADVVRVAAQPGASVSPASGALFTLLPRKPRIVRAELNDSFAGVVVPGMQAQVTAESGGDGQQWAAHVVRIGEVYGPATLDNDPQVRANARTVECVLAFDQSDAKPVQDLRIGQRVMIRFGEATQTAAPAAKE